MIDIEPVRAWMTQLIGEGFVLSHLARTADVDQKLAWNMINRDQSRVHGRDGRALLALTRARIIAAPDDNDEVPHLGATRRLHALMRIGWPHTALAGTYNEEQLLQRISRSRGQRIKARNYRWMAALFDRYALTPGPSNSARIRAEKRGLAPPLAWSDDTIDDPNAQPDLGAPNRITPDQWLTEALHLWEGGVHPAGILRRTNLGPDTARKRILQHNPMHPLVHGFNKEIRRAKHAREQEGAA